MVIVPLYTSYIRKLALIYSCLQISLVIMQERHSSFAGMRSSESSTEVTYLLSSSNFLDIILSFNQL